MPRAARQLVIGVDAMEWDLVTRWAAEGKLPTFSRLMEQGTSGELRTTSAQLPDTVWASLYTGVNPAKLEKFFYVQYDARTMGLRHVLDDAIQRSPFWHHLSEAGRRVGVVVERRISHVWFSRRAEQSQAEGPSRPARRSPHRRGLLSRARRSILKA